MRRNVLLVFSCVVAIAGTCAAQGRVSQLPSDQEAARHGLTRRWFAHAPIDGVREYVQRVTVVNDQLHVQTNSSRIHVMDSETGKHLWSAQLGDPIPGQFGSAINSHSVFVINGSRLYRLSREDGSQLWSIRLGHTPNAAPAADEDRVMVSTLNGRLVVYSVHSKEVLWFYQTNAPISMPATLLDEKIACASQDRKLYVFQPTSRDPLIRYETDAPLSAPMAIWGRTVLLPSQDFNVYSVDVRTGDTMWRYSSGSEIHRPLTVIENDVYVSPDDGGFHALNAENGTRVWRHPRAQDFVAATKARVYVMDRYGQLLILDRATGRQLSAWNTNQFQFRARNTINDRIYLVAKSGLIVCLHEKENVNPLVHPKVLPAPAPGAEARAPGDAVPAGS